MAILCFDPVTGASGDMILGALLDVGADVDRVRTAVKSAGVEGFEIAFSRTVPEGQHIRYGRCEITTEEQSSHRHLSDIYDIIGRADVPERARRRALTIFRRLAEAEAAVHGIGIDEVHFHEVGAVDTIVDVLGTCIALEDLEVERVYNSGFKIGTGMISCSHGDLPLPAPATAKLIEGHPVTRLDIDAELTTPTGAAILTTLSDGAWHGMRTRLVRCGTGRGSRTLGSRPNILRAYLAEDEAAAESAAVLECEVDDQTAEVSAILARQLLKNGALDVSLTPVTMKKGRPGTRITVIAREGKTPDLTNLLLRESTTAGVRVHRPERYVLPRTHVSAETPWGTVKAKRIERPDGVEIVAEADACEELAGQTGIPVRRVMDAAHAWIPADAGEEIP